MDGCSVAARQVQPFPKCLLDLTIFVSSLALAISGVVSLTSVFLSWLHPSGDCAKVHVLYRAGRQLLPGYFWQLSVAIKNFTFLTTSEIRACSLRHAEGNYTDANERPSIIRRSCAYVPMTEWDRHGRLFPRIHSQSIKRLIMIGCLAKQEEQ